MCALKRTNCVFRSKRLRSNLPAEERDFFDAEEQLKVYEASNGTRFKSWDGEDDFEPRHSSASLPPSSSCLPSSSSSPSVHPSSPSSTSSSSSSSMDTVRAQIRAEIKADVKAQLKKLEDKIIAEQAKLGTAVGTLNQQCKAVQCLSSCVYRT